MPIFLELACTDLLYQCSTLFDPLPDVPIRPGQPILTLEQQDAINGNPASGAPAETYCSQLEQTPVLPLLTSVPPTGDLAPASGTHMPAQQAFQAQAEDMHR